jgi:tRNA-dihydrouridine synthase B
MLSIGPITVDSPLVLAPMAGISDPPFRLLNRSFGCRFAFTEMISARSLVYNNKTTIKMLSSPVEDRPLGVQIVSADSEIIKRALDILSNYPFDIIDFNAACPVSKVVSIGEGAGLLREPVKLQKLMRVMVDHAGKPVTIKIRSGWDDASVNAADIALRAQDAGVKGLFIHGRTRAQLYSGRVNYDIIGKVKKCLTIPVIASGDALSPQLIRKMFDETGCDAVAVARGALGNPWIFRETFEYLKNSTNLCKPHVHEIAQAMKNHLALLVRFHGETTGVLRFRKFFGWYAKGMAVKQLKVMAFNADTEDEMVRLIGEMETVPSHCPPVNCDV